MEKTQLFTVALGFFLLCLVQQITASCEWCVAKETSTDREVGKALEWACMHGADCGLIEPGKPCFKEGDAKATAAYAFNDYYSKFKGKNGTCDFQGAAHTTTQDPSFKDCKIPSKCEWCIANPAKSDEQVSKARDWACKNGADCVAIQRGAPCDKGDLKASVSYVLNDYYRKNKAKGGTCDFEGAAIISDKDPSYKDCDIPGV